MTSTVTRSAPTSAGDDDASAVEVGRVESRRPFDQRSPPTRRSRARTAPVRSVAGRVPGTIRSSRTPPVRAVRRALRPGGPAPPGSRVACTPRPSPRGTRRSAWMSRVDLAVADDAWPRPPRCPRPRPWCRPAPPRRPSPGTGGRTTPVTPMPAVLDHVARSDDRRPPRRRPSRSRRPAARGRRTRTRRCRAGPAAGSGSGARRGAWPSGTALRRSRRP